ncbi:hypothetical protein EW093_02040 [Thiospirochaeta perfilievii]|uniref:Zf-HC2 domain-containing protein n=1 Tax=Thiospirochaeta perfilievii TaxID=252967 RepID=A0A5C1Q868_9SPIO|nr:zf-HC2 domain-containing protein [Thiospirochaeta perfilievii]QEN03528.1 hypothetical protein EW093_02040 [Thiospirochaeta perfilievii]
MGRVCDKYKLKIGALADGELNLRDDETSDFFLHLSSCSSCRNEYYDLLELNRRISITGEVKPPEDLFIEFEKKRSSKVIRTLGFILILVPYLTMIFVGIWDFINNSDEYLLMRVSTVGVLSGVVLLLIYTVIGRVKESKKDRYKEIVR